MERHISLLSLLYIAFGALGALLAVAILSLAGGAAAMVVSANDERRSVAAGFTAAIFAAIALAMLVWAAANAGTGLALRRHAPAARIAALLLSILNLFVVPFGTALGIYGFWVLLQEESRRLFEADGRPGNLI